MNRRGDDRTSDVKMNWNRALLKRVMMYSACVLPRRRELAVRIEMSEVQL